jgi:hypothetical protein
MVDMKNSHSQRVVATVRHSLKDQVPVFETQIAQHVAFKEAVEVGRSILDYQSRGAPADTYRQLAREVAIAAGDETVTALEVRRGGVFASAGRFLRGLLSRGHTHQPELARAT